MKQEYGIRNTELGGNIASRRGAKSPCWPNPVFLILNSAKEAA